MLVQVSLQPVMVDIVRLHNFPIDRFKAANLSLHRLRANKGILYQQYDVRQIGPGQPMVNLLMMISERFTT
jgi:hypothetical protein